MLCAWCRAEFTPKHPRGRFCSGRCRVASWHAEQRRPDPERVRRLQDLARPLVKQALLLAKEVGLGPDDLA